MCGKNPEVKTAFLEVLSIAGEQGEGVCVMFVWRIFATVWNSYIIGAGESGYWVQAKVLLTILETI